MYPGKSNLDYRSLNYRPLALILFHGVKCETHRSLRFVFPHNWRGAGAAGSPQISILMSLAARVGTARRQGYNFILLFGSHGDGS